MADAVRNDITLNIIKSKPGTVSDQERYDEGWERIFGKKPKPDGEQLTPTSNQE